jgi:predicted small metal-binding protein
VAKVFTCQCGVVLRGETDDELVAKAQRHAREVHNMEITREHADQLRLGELGRALPRAVAGTSAAAHRVGRAPADPELPGDPRDRPPPWRKARASRASPPHLHTSLLLGLRVSRARQEGPGSPPEGSAHFVIRTMDYS